MGYLPLNAIRAFESAARHLSISAAGDELHVTHAAISHQVKRLEDWLGVSLFDRRARRLRLTDQGAVLLASAGGALRDLEQACRRIQRSAMPDQVSVGCIPSIASRWLVPRMPSFMAAHPGIALRVMYARADEQLKDGETDVLITLGADPSPDVVSLKLFSRINRPVCSPHYLRRRQAMAQPADIAAADLLHDESRDGWREWFAKAGLRNADVSKGPVFADFNILATAVIAGHGVALCPVEVFSEELRRGDLTVVSDTATSEDRGYFLTMAANASPSARTFAAWFLDDVAAARQTG